MKQATAVVSAAFFGIMAMMVASAARADALDDIMKAKVIKVAVPQDFAPFGSAGPDLKPVGYDIDMANLNAPGQIIISGEVDKVNAAAAVAKDYGFKMAKVLDVAGAYHSRLMEPARAAFEAFLKDIPFSAPKVPVFTNVTGLRVSDPAEMKRMLVRQVVSSVLWEDDMRSAVALGMDDFLECGIGGVLAGIAKRTDKAWNVRSISEHADIAAL